jgi:hypothetical protein
MAMVEDVTLWGVERMSGSSLWGGWVWTCRRMIGARIEESRREKMGRVHRLSCVAKGPDRPQAPRIEMSTRHA